MTSLHLIRRRDRMEFKAGRNAAPYRSQRSDVRDTTNNQSWSWAASPARLTGTASPLIRLTASAMGKLLSNADPTPGTGATAGRLGAKTDDRKVLVRQHHNV